MKVVMLGREAGGKTSLVHRYLYESFSGLKYQAVSAVHLVLPSLLATPDCPLLSISAALASLYLVSFQLARWFSVGFITVPHSHTLYMHKFGSVRMPNLIFFYP